MIIGCDEMNQENIARRKPRRTTEIWKLSRENNTITALGPDGLIELNQLGAFLWLRFDGLHSLSDILIELGDLYPEVQPAQLQTDLSEFFSYLRSQRLVVSTWDPLEGVCMNKGRQPS
ncbi:MAG: PqqD family peptide modification chaperone [Candidatus Aegiribacteria sp.]|nr:PqqD family peptide modification chaperone [Candidatus Aegiribacteria sp.]